MATLAEENELFKWLFLAGPVYKMFLNLWWKLEGKVENKDKNFTFSVINTEYQARERFLVVNFNNNESILT